MVTQFPTDLVQGETFTATFDIVADTLVLNFRGAGTQNVTGSSASGEWKATADTTSWTPGSYLWEAWATKDGLRTLVTRQRLELEQSVVNGLPGGTVLNQYEQIVQAIESHLAGNGQDPTWRRYRINGREMERYDTAELLRLLGYYKRLAAMERRKQRGQSVLGPHIRFRI